MIIMNNDTKSIQFSLTNNTTAYIDFNSKRIVHEANLPKVICTNKTDAEYIQEKINEYINKLSHELLK